MIVFQRAMALLMALAMCAFIVPIAVARHHLDIAVAAVAIFLAWVAVNAYLWTRMRQRQRP